MARIPQTFLLNQVFFHPVEDCLDRAVRYKSFREIEDVKLGLLSFKLLVCFAAMTDNPFIVLVCWNLLILSQCVARCSSQDELRYNVTRYL